MVKKLFLEIGERRYPLKQGTTEIGRSAEKDITLHTASISSSHAMIEVDSDQCVIRDSGSANGTYVNDNRVTPGVRHPLRQGDLIKLGKVSAKIFAIDSPTVVEDTASYKPYDIAAQISDRYTIRETLETNDTYTMFRAYDTEREITVLIKAIKLAAAEDLVTANSFRRECRLVKKLMHNPHPNIVRILYVEPTMCSNYYIMEDMGGNTIKDCVLNAGPIPEVLSLDICIQLAQALSVMHDQFQILHRDIQPENIVLTSELVPKFCNLGGMKIEESAMLTVGEEIKGNLLFSAPEIYSSSENYSIQSDIFSLGATLYYMLSGHPPFADMEQILAYNHDGSYAPKPLDNPQISKIVFSKMVTRESSQRFADYQQLIGQFQQLRKKLGGDGEEGKIRNASSTKAKAKAKSPAKAAATTATTRANSSQAQQLEGMINKLQAKVRHLEAENKKLRCKLEKIGAIVADSSM